MLGRTLCAWVLIAGSAAWADAAPVRVKDVSASPTDIERGVVGLPDPSMLGVVSRSALVRIDQVFEGGRWVWRERIDAKGLGARVALLDTGGVAVDAALVGPDGQRIRIGRGAGVDGVVRSRSRLSFIGTDRAFDGVALGAQRRGAWTLEVVSAARASGYAVIDSGSGHEIRTHADTLGAVVGDLVTLESALSEGFVLTELRAFVRGPMGVEREVLAGPGETRVSFVPRVEGTHAVRVVARGTDAGGGPVVLSTQHAVPVHAPVQALGQPRVGEDGGVIRVGFEGDDRRVILAAQVWGTRAGEGVPVCFVSRVCEGDRSLRIDPRWVARAGVDPDSLTLRALRVHDAASGRPVHVEEGPVALGAVGMEIIADLDAPITDAMRTGRGSVVGSVVGSVSGDRAPTARGAGGGHRLLLVHGYCSDGNPFPTSQFTGDLAVFDDPNASRSHDAFALEILSQTQGLKSFGVAAHSQGGMAALHLRTFYFSGLDWARGDRLIQSVGTPYQGTALAGNAAVLGDLFGFGCGVNDSLTYDGAAAWLSLIPSWARQDVWYWTTSFEDRPFLYDFCNFATDLFLSDPDDGVIERSAGQLSGATNMGHLEGWCHTDDMRDPGQCTDAARNSEINARAKR